MQKHAKSVREIGITPELKNNIGATGAISGCHGLIARKVAESDGGCHSQGNSKCCIR